MKVRVLVAEDSHTSRHLIKLILSADPSIEVVGEALDGQQAVALTRELKPDVVTMDIRMPRLDGFEATKEIMIQAPTPIVVVTASTEVSEVAFSLQALRAGALLVLPKPVGPSSPEFEKQAEELREQVKAMSQVKVVRHFRSRRPPEPLPVSPARERSKIAVIAVATSTGGPPALQQVLSGLDGSVTVPILVVQHIARGFTEGLVRWLNSAVSQTVKVATDFEDLRPGHVYLAPEDRHLGVRPDGTAEVSAAPPLHGFRPSASHLFSKAARAFGEEAVGVILTGMGEDGVAGLRDLRAAGGYVIAQDEKTSAVFGMPAAAIQAGVVDVVLPLPDIAPHVSKVARPLRAWGEGTG